MVHPVNVSGTLKTNRIYISISLALYTKDIKVKKGPLWD